MTTLEEKLEELFTSHSIENENLTDVMYYEMFMDAGVELAEWIVNRFNESVQNEILRSKE